MNILEREQLQNQDQKASKSGMVDIEYRLGMAYSHTPHLSMAINYLEKVLAYAQREGDKKKEGLAQAALAKCHEK
jgi:hypothetical protein